MGRRNTDKKDLKIKNCQNIEEKNTKIEKNIEVENKNKMKTKTEDEDVFVSGSDLAALNTPLKFKPFLVRVIF